MADVRKASGSNVRIGPISVLALIAILSMAVLSVLAVSTANASLLISQRQADSTAELYLDELAAQDLLAEVDAQLAPFRAGSARAASSPQVAVQASLQSAVAHARAAADERVEAYANVDGNVLSAEFTCENGRTLSISVTLNADGTYHVDSWKMSVVENSAVPNGTLYLG